jgi:hypothetical protein
MENRERDKDKLNRNQSESDVNRDDSSVDFGKKIGKEEDIENIEPGSRQSGNVDSSGMKGDSGRSSSGGLGSKGNSGNRSSSDSEIEH